MTPVHIVYRVSSHRRERGVSTTAKCRANFDVTARKVGRRGFARRLTPIDERRECGTPRILPSFPAASMGLILMLPTRKAPPVPVTASRTFSWRSTRISWKVLQKIDTVDWLSTRSGRADEVWMVNVGVRLPIDVDTMNMHGQECTRKVMPISGALRETAVA